MTRAVFVYECRYCGECFDGDPEEEHEMFRRYNDFVDGNVPADIHWSRKIHECFDHIYGIGDLVAIKMLNIDRKSTDEKETVNVDD